MPEPNKNLAILLSLFTPMERSRVRDTVIAVNIDVMTPLKNSKANPLMSADVAK